MEEILKRLNVLVLLLNIVPFIVGMLRRKRLVAIQRKLLYLIILIVVVEITSYLFWYNGVNNHPIFHFYSVLEFVLLLNIYKTNLGRWFTTSIAFPVGIAFVLFAIVNVLFLQSLLEFNSNVTTLSAVLIIFLSLSSFYELLRGPNYTSLHLNPVFWINAGLIIYFSSNLVLFYLSNKIDLSREDSYTIWGVHSIFNCLLIIFYTIALWIQPMKD